MNAFYQHFIASLDVIDGVRVLVDFLTSLVSTFELQGIKIVLDVSMDSSELDVFISLALFGTMTVVLSPGINTTATEQGLTAAALERPFNNHGADSANEEVSSLPLGLVIDH